jgi:hypothetical protein
VIAGSQYKRQGKIDPQASYHAEAMKLASQIALSGFQPDRVWVMDICRTTDGRYSMLEIGGFSFADLYACDKDAIVSEDSRVAVADWEAAND